MLSQTISKALKNIRIKNNQTLQEVALHAGTSVAAMHRYENGWGRFEIATLQKLAAALGKDLQVSFVNKPTQEKMNTRSVFRKIKPLFWDTKISKQEMKTHATWITLRVLDLGNLAQVRAWVFWLGIKAVKEIYLKNQKKLSKKTQAAWLALCGKENHAH